MVAGPGPGRQSHARARCWWPSAHSCMPVAAAGAEIVPFSLPNSTSLELHRCGQAGGCCRRHGRAAASRLGSIPAPCLPCAPAAQPRLACLVWEAWQCGSAAAHRPLVPTASICFCRRLDLYRGFLSQLRERDSEAGVLLVAGAGEVLVQADPWQHPVVERLLDEVRPLC